MARYAGRVIVNKVDSNGKKIKDFTSWRLKNPNALYFDSKVEWEVWYYLSQNKIPYHTQTELLLFDSVDTEEFKQPRQTKKAKKEGNKTPSIKQIKQQSIKYTPDYYLPEFNTYIEVKGFADELFKLRWKLFKIKGYRGFIVYSLDEFKQLYSVLLKSKNVKND